MESCAAAQECHLITEVTCRSLPADYYAARCEHKIEWHRNFLNEISFLADINLPCTSPTHALWACAIGGDRQQAWAVWRNAGWHSSCAVPGRLRLGHGLLWAAIQALAP